MQLRALLAALEQAPVGFYEVVKEMDAIEVTGLAYDSRQVKTGEMFIAVPGTHTDGRRFLADAMRRGADVLTRRLSCGP